MDLHLTRFHIFYPLTLIPENGWTLNNEGVKGRQGNEINPSLRLFQISVTLSLLHNSHELIQLYALFPISCVHDR